MTTSRSASGIQGGSAGLIDRLERRGHVRRIRPDNNRRVVLIELTTTGQDLSNALFGPLLALLHQYEHDRDDEPG
jgi:DNA-binding MarR family transcriptional regulator